MDSRSGRRRSRSSHFRFFLSHTGAGRQNPAAKKSFRICGRRWKAPVVHDDLMVIYREAGMTRAFYDDSEGHVIHYNVSISADKKQIIFLSEQAAAQPRYRLTYQNLGAGSVTVVFEIAPPDKPEQFSKYVEGTVHRRFTSNP